MQWVKHHPGPTIGDRCASDKCNLPPSWRLEAGGVASYYCFRCKDKIDSDPHWTDMEHAGRELIRETITFTFTDEAQQRRFHQRLKGQPWVCGARKQGTAGGHDPADCDWPFCGCDHDAEEVVSTLREMGWLSPDEKNEYARNVREQAFREAAADSKE